MEPRWQKKTSKRVLKYGLYPTGPQVAQMASGGRLLKPFGGSFLIIYVKKWLNRVLVGRFGPRICENGACGFWEAYGTPPGAQNGDKKFKNGEKCKKSEIRKFRKITYLAALFFRVGGMGAAS